MIVVMLALASMSSQNLLGFGEFIAGHNELKIFKVLKVSDAKYNKVISSMRIAIHPISAEQFDLDGPCFRSIATVNREPYYSLKTCKPDQSEAQRYVYTLLNIKLANSASILFKQKPKVDFEIKEGSRSITFVLRTKLQTQIVRTGRQKVFKGAISDLSDFT